MDCINEYPVSSLGFLRDNSSINNNVFKQIDYEYYDDSNFDYSDRGYSFYFNWR